MLPAPSPSGPFAALAGSAVNRTVAGAVEPTGGADPAGALVTLWTPPREPRGAANVALAFGRRAPDPGTCLTVAVADAAGRFSLTVPRTGDHLLRADCAPAGLAPGDPVTPANRPAPAVLPVAVRAGENAATLAPPLAGTIAGRADVRPWDPGPAWAVVFDGDHLLRAAPVAADGAFRFDGLPPGEYGVKAGRLGGTDREAFGGAALYELPAKVRTDPAFLADPWRRAVRVAVAPGETAAAAVAVMD